MAPTPVPPRIHTGTSMPVPGASGPGIALHTQHPTPSATPVSQHEVLHFCFCVPFRIIPGPEPSEIMLASEGAIERWLHPRDSPPNPSVHKLPIHQLHLERLRKICKDLTDTEPVRATVTVSEPRPTKGKKRGAVINVSLAGDPEMVYSTRAYILQSLPVALRMERVDIEQELFYGPDGQILPYLSTLLKEVAQHTGADIFVMKPKPELGPGGQEVSDTIQASRLRIQIYGDSESVEIAKTRILIIIDDLLKSEVHCSFINISLIPLVCGRARKNVKMIESSTGAAIYFPPPFPGVFGYTPESAKKRLHDQIFITALYREHIEAAEKMLVELATSIQIFMKTVSIGMLKADYIILERLDDVKKIMEANGTFVQFPVLGAAKGVLRVQGTEQMYVEKTVKQIMQITGQYYNASWWLLDQPSTSRLRPPTDKEIQQMLTDISAYSGAEISFNKNGFEIHGSDESVKWALEIAQEVKFVKQGAYQIRVKIELANEHKEFVAGKKNGKINKIMGQSNVQVMFDAFNEYNFYICVVGSKYQPAMLGLELVEQELPAAVSFYVPDQYHKRIIGIQGAHIQRLMKKYSVYVKFLNPMERESGTGGWLDADLVGDNNVVIRTPARNAANLELVKREIMDTVQKVDAEIVTENVIVPRLFHRALIAHSDRIAELEKKWSCNIIFPSNEEASDIVVVKGPEWQLPEAVNEFLSLVPENHRIQIPWSPRLPDVIQEEDFIKSVIEPIKEKFDINVYFGHISQDSNHEKNGPPETQPVELTYTRNNSGYLQDALSLLTEGIAKYGLNSEPVKGGLPRPKSDTFEDCFPFFNSKVLQSAPAPMPQEEVRRLSREMSADAQVELGKMIGTEAVFNRPPGSRGSTASNSSHHSFAQGFDTLRQNRSQRQSVSSSASGSAQSANWADTEGWGKSDALTQNSSTTSTMRST